MMATAVELLHLELMNIPVETPSTKIHRGVSIIIVGVVMTSLTFNMIIVGFDRLGCDIHEASVTPLLATPSGESLLQLTLERHVAGDLLGTVLDQRLVISQFLLETRGEDVEFLPEVLLGFILLLLLFTSFCGFSHNRGG